MNIISIDAQNLYMASKSRQKPLDYEILFTYFTKEKGFDRVDMYLGYLHHKRDFYAQLQSIGYTLFFKNIYKNSLGETKANVDIDIAIQTVSDHRDGIVSSWSLLSGDSDFISLIQYFKKHNLFRSLYVPNKQFCSRQLRQQAGVRLIDLEELYTTVMSFLPQTKTPDISIKSL